MSDIKFGGLAMSFSYIAKAILMGVFAVINACLFIMAFIGFLCFFINLTYGDIEPIFKSFMLGFSGLFLGIVAYDCNVLIWEKWF